MAGKVRKVRKLSYFLCQELMYDYITGKLDEERTQAVEDFIGEHEEAKQDLKAMVKSLEYTALLGTTKLSEPLLVEISQHENKIDRLLSKLSWSKWPEVTKWGIEALGLSILVAIVAIFIPWRQLEDLIFPNQRPVTLIEVHKKAKTVAEVEHEKQKNKKTVKITENNQTKLSLKVTKEETSTSEKEKVSLLAENKSVSPEAKQNINVSKVDLEKEKEEVNAAKERESTKGNLKGVLYRAYMNVDDLNQATPEMIKMIKELGGLKAGQVKLGWEKTNSRYYHFSFPEKNYNELIQKLRSFGPVRIYKYAHRRKMSEGKLRIILEVKKKQ